jgi:hypothetical protein
LFCDVVVAVGIEQRGLGVLLLLCLDDVADIDQLVVPGVERSDLGRIVGEQIRDEGLYTNVRWL